MINAYQVLYCPKKVTLDESKKRTVILGEYQSRIDAEEFIQANKNKCVGYIKCVRKKEDGQNDKISDSK